MTTSHPNAPGTDYCPHCACYHVIGRHPRDGETERQYWQRMNRKRDQDRALQHWHAGMPR